VRVEAHLFSKSALDKIQAAGGEAVVIGADPGAA
jgi:ribosomal protein L18E